MNNMEKWENQPTVQKGYERQWSQCKKCDNVAYHDFVPYSLSNPIMCAPCGHGLTESFSNTHKNITPEQAKAWFALQDQPKALREWSMALKTMDPAELRRAGNKLAKYYRKKVR